MTIALALEYIPRRMKELGFEANYYMRFKHLVLQASEKLEIDADNQFYFLVEEAFDISISSSMGYYDISETASNEQSYEHQGNILIDNYGQQINHVRFIQIIPKNKTE
jgi:hypothetical protein